ncbi:hypothetical protein D3C72_1108810 [compost metagenome]
MLRIQGERAAKVRIVFATQPAHRLIQHQTRLAHQHGAVLQFIETGRERRQFDGTVAPLSLPGHIPAGIHRREVSLTPVAPLPQAAVRQEVIGLSVEVQHEIAHVVFMGFQNRLQPTIHPFLREFNARQRPADFIDIERVDKPTA